MKFSEVVYNLAQEEEPAPIRSAFNQTGRVMLSGTSTTTKPVLKCDAMKKSTLTASLKDKYIVRTRHDRIGAQRFSPANRSEAKKLVKTTIDHDTETYVGDAVCFKRAKQHDTNLHGSKNFLCTSPVSQDI